MGYTYQTIDVPGVDALALTASSDFEDYAGNTQGPDGQKTVSFTLIDGVYKTYDFPGSKNTYFYALGNNGTAAGYYEDSNGMSHGVILENGELRQYDFPDAVETQIYGYSDATGAFTGNYIDAAGVRRGFTAENSIEIPGATATFADFVTSHGIVAGSYIDAEGIYHAYGLYPDGSHLIVDHPEAANLEFLFYHGISDQGIGVVRVKAMDAIPRTYVGRLVLYELQFPGSVSTEGWNVNQDGSVVGHYDSPDGRTHGFIARPVAKAVSTQFGNTYTATLAKGLNMLSVPLAPPTPLTAKSLAGIAGATTVITLDAASQQFVAWTPDAPNDGFQIEGDKGYIVNVPESRNFAFVGSGWTNPTEAAAAAPALTPLIRGDRGLSKKPGHSSSVGIWQANRRPMAIRSASETSEQTV